MHRLKGRKVLVVDQEGDSRELLCEALAQEGAQVFETSDEAGALALMVAHPIDAVVSDMLLAASRGPALFARIKEENPMLPVIVVMENVAGMSFEDAYARGAEGIYLKSLPPAPVVEAIYRALLSPRERWRPKGSRIPVSYEIVLVFDEIQEEITAGVLNIGRGGMFVSLHQGALPPLGQTLRFSISFKRGPISQLHGMGICRWLRKEYLEKEPRGFGMEFVEVQEDEVDRLINYIKNNVQSKLFIPVR